MRTCDSCGFENCQPGKSCPLCGSSELTSTTLPLDAVETVVMPAGGLLPATAGGSLVGTDFGGRYRVAGLLGRGGMGQVYRARDLERGGEVALKVMRPGTEEDPTRVERFRREIGVLSKLSHPSIPPIHDWGIADGQLYFASELVDGEDLKALVRARGAWPAAQAAELVATVADALAAAHANGVIHRDVKLNNIMQTRDGAVRLLDFGLARGVGIDMTTLTRTGVILGTPGYMSPEQFEAAPVDARSDVYSLGVVLFELLTGRLPFVATTPIALALKHRAEPPPAPRQFAAELPAWLERVCLRCLEKDPERRFQSAAELAEQLRRAPGSRERERLPSGDYRVDEEPWALVLECRAEKVGWATGMTLAFEDRHYKLEEVEPPGGAMPLWCYRFGSWPATEVFRRFLDYEQDCAERGERPAGLAAKLQRWLGRPKD